MKFRDYKATPEAIEQARAIGLYGDTGKRLLRAAKRSARFTSELGNRRFLDFVLTVEGDQDLWIDRLNGQTA